MTASKGVRKRHKPPSSAAEVKGQIDNLRKTLDRLEAQGRTKAQVQDSISTLQRKLKEDFGEEY
jgi:hypothetical protein